MGEVQLNGLRGKPFVRFFCYLAGSKCPNLQETSISERVSIILVGNNYRVIVWGGCGSCIVTVNIIGGLKNVTGIIGYVG